MVCPLSALQGATHTVIVQEQFNADGSTDHSYESSSHMGLVAGSRQQSGSNHRVSSALDGAIDGAMSHLKLAAEALGPSRDDLDLHQQEQDEDEERWQLEEELRSDPSCFF